MRGGKTLRFEGTIKKVKNKYQLLNGSRSISFIALNSNILHFLEGNSKLMVGNAGWSYSLNNDKPAISSEFSFEPASAVFTDSLVFQGRTPCKIPGLEKAGTTCYKLKWDIVMYPGAENSSFGEFRLYGTKWRAQEPMQGYWKIIKGKEERILYSFFEKNNVHLFTLLRAGDDIVYFTDDDGNPLVGNEDFSYSLNRKN